MADTQEMTLVTKKQQPVKEIIHQDIFHLQETIEHLHAWSELLHSLQTFFDQKELPLHKKKIIKDYHAYAQLFTIFHQDYQHILTTLDEQVDDLRARPKVRV